MEYAKSTFYLDIFDVFLVGAHLIMTEKCYNLSVRDKGTFGMKFDDAIKKLRKKLLLSQTEFEEYLGVSFAMVNRWERGRFEPTIRLKRKLTPLFKEHDIEVEEK